jgi:hypothetical protein
MNVHETQERAVEACGVHCSKVQTFAMKLSNIQQTALPSPKDGYGRKHYVTDMNNSDKNILH